ncbi:Hypothetical protein AA314_05622 [Archangium gephyra]|nr:Hypothetical protein AA314_05622 [Archangium gephyra]
MSPSAAAAALMGERQPSSAEARTASEALDPIGAAEIAADDLSMALAAAFGTALKPAELASIIHTQFPKLSALGVAQAVQAGLPNTRQADMYNALTGCDFSAGDAQGAVNILYPATVTVQSNQVWQATGVTVTGQQLTAIICTSGSWTANPATGMCGANGNPGYTARPGYTLPGAPEGALIGKIGDNAPFLVGTSQNVMPGQSGMLSLCINDDLNGQYGAGLGDNVGSLVVTITTQAPV